MLSRKDRPWVPGHHGTRAPFPSPLREGWGQGVRAPSLAEGPAQASLGRTEAPGVNGCFPTPSPQPPPSAPTLDTGPEGHAAKGWHEADACLCTLLPPPPPGKAPSPSGTGKRGWETGGGSKGKAGGWGPWLSGPPVTPPPGPTPRGTFPLRWVRAQTKRSAPECRLLTPRHPLPCPPGAA